MTIKEELLKLSKEEVVDKYVDLETEVSSAKTELALALEKIGLYEVEQRRLNSEIDELRDKLDRKQEVNNKQTIERFCSRKESIKEIYSDGETDEDVSEDVLKEVPLPKKKRVSSNKTFISELEVLKEKVTIDFDFIKNGIDPESVRPIGSDITRKIIYSPPSFKVQEIIRPKYAYNGTVYQSLNDDIFSHSPLTPSFAANIVEMKFSLGIPLYRYSSYLESIGLPVSRQTLSNYVFKTARALEPLYLRLKEKLVNNKAHVIYSDETTINITDLKDRINSYIFVYVTSPYDEQILIYDFNESRNMDNTKNMLKDYKGYIVSDCYSGYDSLESEKIKFQKCGVHLRRYFYDAYKVLPTKTRNDSLQAEAIRRIDKIFDMEKEFIKKDLTPAQIKKERNSIEYEKLIDDVDSFIMSIEAKEGTYLETAVNYYKNHRLEYWTYKQDGHIEFSNNRCERAVKTWVIARKNFLFCKTSEGAYYAGLLVSIIQTAKANLLHSESYLTWVLENINKLSVDDLLPFSDKIPSCVRIKQSDF